MKKKRQKIKMCDEKKRWKLMMKFISVKTEVIVFGRMIGKLFGIIGKNGKKGGRIELEQQ